MDFQGNQSLSAAALSADPYGRRGGRNPPDEREDLLYPRPVAYQVPEYATKTQAASESASLWQTFCGESRDPEGS